MPGRMDFEGCTVDQPEEQVALLHIQDSPQMWSMQYKVHYLSPSILIMQLPFHLILSPKVPPHPKAEKIIELLKEKACQNKSPWAVIVPVSAVLLVW